MVVSAQSRRQVIPYVPSPWWGVLLLLAIIAGLAGLALGAVYLWLNNAPPETKVPDVTGINLRAAEEMLARRGLIGQVAGRRYDSKAPANSVIAETPVAGRVVRQGRVVEMVVSDGPPWAYVPDLRETDLKQAREAIAQVDLRLLRIKRRYSVEVPQDWVIEQAPAPGERVSRKSAVELVVSAGPKPVEEPAQPQAEAKQAVVQVSLPEGDRESLVRIEVEDERGITVVHSDTHPAGSTLSWVVTGYGDAVARVYVDNELIEEKRF